MNSGSRNHNSKKFNISFRSYRDIFHFQIVPDEIPYLCGRSATNDIPAIFGLVCGSVYFLETQAMTPRPLEHL